MYIFQDCFGCCCPCCQSSDDDELRPMVTKSVPSYDTIIPNNKHNDKKIRVTDREHDVHNVGINPRLTEFDTEIEKQPEKHNERSFDRNVIRPSKIPRVSDSKPIPKISNDTKGTEDKDTILSFSSGQKEVLKDSEIGNNTKVHIESKIPVSSGMKEQKERSGEVSLIEKKDEEGQSATQEMKEPSENQVKPESKKNPFVNDGEQIKCEIKRAKHVDKINQKLDTFDETYSPSIKSEDNQDHALEIEASRSKKLKDGKDNMQKSRIPKLFDTKSISKYIEEQTANARIETNDTYDQLDANSHVGSILSDDTGIKDDLHSNPSDETLTEDTESNINSLRTVGEDNVDEKEETLTKGYHTSLAQKMQGMSEDNSQTELQADNNVEIKPNFDIDTENQPPVVEKSVIAEQNSNKHINESYLNNVGSSLQDLNKIPSVNLEKKLTWQHTKLKTPQQEYQNSIDSDVTAVITKESNSEKEQMLHVHSRMSNNHQTDQSIPFDSTDIKLKPQILSKSVNKNAALNSKPHGPCTNENVSPNSSFNIEQSVNNTHNTIDIDETSRIHSDLADVKITSSASSEKKLTWHDTVKDGQTIALNSTSNIFDETEHPQVEMKKGETHASGDVLKPVDDDLHTPNVHETEGNGKIVQQLLDQTKNEAHDVESEDNKVISVNIDSGLESQLHNSSNNVGFKDIKPWKIAPDVNKGNAIEQSQLGSTSAAKYNTRNGNGTAMKPNIEQLFEVSHNTIHIDETSTIHSDLADVKMTSSASPEKKLSWHDTVNFTSNIFDGTEHPQVEIEKVEAHASGDDNMKHIEQGKIVSTIDEKVDSEESSSYHSFTENPAKDKTEVQNIAELSKPDPTIDSKEIINSRVNNDLLSPSSKKRLNWADENVQQAHGNKNDSDDDNLIAVGFTCSQSKQETIQEDNNIEDCQIYQYEQNRNNKVETDAAITSPNYNNTERKQHKIELLQSTDEDMQRQAWDDLLTGDLLTEGDVVHSAIVNVDDPENVKAANFQPSIRGKIF